MQIDLNDSYVTIPAPAAQALASLSRTCRTVRGEVTDLLDTMRTATVVLGYEPHEYYVSLPHHLANRQWQKVDPGSECLCQMRAIELYLVIDLHYSTGAEDLEERWQYRRRMLNRCEDFLSMLSSSRELEEFWLTVYVVPIGRFEGLNSMGRRLVELLGGFEAEKGISSRNTKDHELAFAVVAVSILKQGIAKPWLLDVWP